MKLYSLRKQHVQLQAPALDVGRVLRTDDASGIPDASSVDDLLQKKSPDLSVGFLGRHPRTMDHY